MSKQEKDKGPKLENKDKPKKKISPEELAKILEQNGYEIDISSFQEKKDIKERVKDQGAQSSKVVDALPPSSYDTVTEVAPPRPSTPPRIKRESEERGTCVSPHPRYVEIKEEKSEQYTEETEEEAIEYKVSKEEEKKQKREMIVRGFGELTKKMDNLININKNHDTKIIRQNENGVLVNQGTFNQLVGILGDLRDWTQRTDWSLATLYNQGNAINQNLATTFVVVKETHESTKELHRKVDTLQKSIDNLVTMVVGIDTSNEEAVKRILEDQINRLQGNINRMQQDIVQFPPDVQKRFDSMETNIKEKLENENFEKKEVENIATDILNNYKEAIQNIIYAIHEIVSRNSFMTNQDIYLEIEKNELLKEYLQTIFDTDKKYSVLKNKDYSKYINTLIDTVKGRTPSINSQIQAEQQEIFITQDVLNSYNNMQQNREININSVLIEIGNTYIEAIKNGPIIPGPIEYLTQAKERYGLQGYTVAELLNTEINANFNGIDKQYHFGNKMEEMYESALKQQKIRQETRSSRRQRARAMRDVK